MPRRDDEHPCDGIWIEADAFCGAPRRTQRAAEETALQAGVAGWTIAAHGWTAELAEALDALPIRVDLAAANGRGGGRKEVERVLDLGADLIGVPVEPQTMHEADGRQAVRRITDRAAEDDVEVVLLMRHGGPEMARQIVESVRSNGGVLAVSVERHDEEVLDTLGEIDGLGVFAPGQEFASSYRRGANAIDRFLGLLSPAGAVHMLELCEKKVVAALDVERRLQRFFETDLDRAARRIAASDEARARLLVALGGWCPSLPAPGLEAAQVDLESLRAALEFACPEMAPFLA